MEFEYFVLADAANVGPDGKVNVLGMGARVITYERLPASSPLSLVALVAAGVDEAGTYEVLVEIEEPDGTRETLLSAPGLIPADGDARVPTGISLVWNFERPFRIEGLHRFHMRVGELTRQYSFLVQRSTGGSSGDSA